MQYKDLSPEPESVNPNVRPREGLLPGNIGNPSIHGGGGQPGNPIGDDKLNLDQVQKFPVLTPKQKQFAVNPESQVFGDQNPDFLQYRLEELDEAPALQEKHSDTDVDGLEEQLQSILGSYSDEVDIYIST